MESIASDEDVKQFKYMADLCEVMDKSGCDVRLTVSILYSPAYLMCIAYESPPFVEFETNPCYTKKEQ